MVLISRLDRTKNILLQAIHLNQSFESAEKTCSALYKSSHLASFHSSKEFHAIAELLLSPSGSTLHFWTGLYRLNETSLPTFNEEFALPYMQLYFTDGSKYNWPIPAQLFNSSNQRPADQSMDSHAFESVLASPELLEEKQYCIQVRSHRGEIEMQEQDCDTKLTFVCKKPATLLHSVRLTHPIYNQLQSTTEKAVEITIDFSLNKNQTSGFKVVTSSTPKTLDSITTESSTNSTEVGLAEFLSMKTSTARLTTTTTTHNNNDSTTSAADEDTTQTSNHHNSSTVELTSAGPNSTTSSEDSSSSSSTDSIETSSLDAENGQGGEEENRHGEGTSLPCFSIATFTWTCVEGEHKNKPSGTTLKALEHNHCSLGTCLGIFLALGLASANPLIEHTREAEHLLDLLRRNNTEVSIHETKMVLYGRIFCAKEEEISVKSRQKRFSSLDELYSAHGYAQSQDMAISRSDGGDVDQGMPAFQPQPLQGGVRRQGSSQHRSDSSQSVEPKQQQLYGYVPFQPNPSYLAPPSQPWEVPAYQPQQPTWQQHQQLQWSSGPKPPPKVGVVLHLQSCGRLKSQKPSNSLWIGLSPSSNNPTSHPMCSPSAITMDGEFSTRAVSSASTPELDAASTSSSDLSTQVPWMRTPHPSHSAPNPAPWMNGPVGQQSVPTQQHPQQSQQQQLHMPQQQVPSLVCSSPPLYASTKCGPAPIGATTKCAQPHQTMAQHQVGQPMRPQQQTQQQMPNPTRL
uniref:C-type lectin domain-containing protein n=1 Tax=Ditylenchus dipsaci TaxID=166011 RepID=A0A915DAT2_9BILA